MQQRARVIGHQVTGPPLRVLFRFGKRSGDHDRGLGWQITCGQPVRQIVAAVAIGCDQDSIRLDPTFGGVGMPAVGTFGQLCHGSLTVDADAKRVRMSGQAIHVATRIQAKADRRTHPAMEPVTRNPHRPKVLGIENSLILCRQPLHRSGGMGQHDLAVGMPLNV